MDQNEIYEIHGILLEWFSQKEKKPSEVMSFITSIWTGQMCLNGYTEEFVDQTLVRMKDDWKHHRLNKYIDKNNSGNGGSMI